MDPERYRFGDFRLEPAERRLFRGAEPVDLNARYLDALILLVREPGVLVTKDRFLDEVWGGVPVTEEALTQCIKTLRRQLGDRAGSPRMIETVPKHGYRFIAAVERGEGASEGATAPAARASVPFPGPSLVLLTAAGTIGGGIAGALGGLFFGFMAVAQSPQGGLGAFSVLLVLLSVNIPIGMLGGAGVGLGIGIAGATPGRSWLRGVLGGAAGGLVVGGAAKLLGVDAFRLLFGRAPGDMTGAGEGLLLGAAVGFGLWLAHRGPNPRLRFGLIVAAIAAGLAGALIALAGGRLMGGSLTLLADAFPQSGLHPELLHGGFGEGTFGRVRAIAEAGLEGAVFGACVVGMMFSAYRHRDRVVAGLQSQLGAASSWT